MMIPACLMSREFKRGYIRGRKFAMTCNWDTYRNWVSNAAAYVEGPSAEWNKGYVHGVADAAAWVRNNG
jgi:hypothetical protein